MFTNLIESSSHKKELERKGIFFLGTLAVYGILIACAGVASIYAYDAQLREQNFDTASLVVPVTVELIPRTISITAPQRRSDTPRLPTQTTNISEVPVRQHLISDIRSSIKPPDTIGLTGSKELPALPNAKIGAVSSDPIGSNAGDMPSFTKGSSTKSSGSKRAIDIVENVLPPDPPHIATHRKTPPLVSLGVINGKALYNPVPLYPPIAKTTRTTGTVNVQVLLNEEGKVISAQALNGPPLLRDAAVKAAYQARFSPTLLSHQPVKVSGVITYNFKLE